MKGVEEAYGFFRDHPVTTGILLWIVGWSLVFAIVIVAGDA